jgi:ATP-binding cassette, subfamily B, multidrug efflux pump
VTAGQGRRAGRSSAVDAKGPKAGFATTARRLLRLVGVQRPFAAMLLLGVASISLNVLGPRLLGQATDILIASATANNAGTANGSWPLAEAQGSQDPVAWLLLSWGPLTARQGSLTSVGLLLALALGVYSLSGLCWILQGRQATRAVQQAAHRLRAEAEAALGRMPLPHVDALGRGNLLSRTTNDIDNVVQMLQQSMSQLSNSALLIAAIVAMMLSLSPLLAVIAVLVVPAAMALTAPLNRWAQRRFAQQWSATGRLTAQVEEGYGNLPLMHAFNQREAAAAAFVHHNEEVRAASYRAQWLSGISQPMMTLVNNLGYVVVAVIGCLRVISGRLSVGGLQAFLQYARQLNGPLSQVTSLVGVVQSGIASAERIFELLDAPREASVPGLPVPEPEGAVRFESVTFRYQPDRPLLEDFSLSVEPHQTVAVVGPTGAGKSTLINLLLRFYDLDAGRITVDGVDITRMPRETLRSRIGVVLQDTWLFTGSLADNIGYGREGATRAEIEEAARWAHVDRLIHNLPNGYDTVIDGERPQLSSGEQQLVSLARAFLAAPAVLVLDEATSRVDTRTELLVRRATARLSRERTTLVIAHRLSTIRDADMILVMERGAIVEQGTHDQLLAARGAYARLHDMRFRQPMLEPGPSPFGDVR